MRYGIKMGSKTKYYTDLQVNNMFDPEDHLWGHELARVAASVNSMSASDILPTVAPVHVNDVGLAHVATSFGS